MKLQLKRNKYLILFCLAFVIQSLSSQNIESLYVNMPDGLNPTLTRQNRLELLEYYKAKQNDTIMNRFGNPVNLLFFDSIQQCLVVQNTPVSIFEMKLFNRKDGTPAIGIIHTVCGSICQSNIEFYDTAWTPVDLKFRMPKAIEWLDKTKFMALGTDSDWIKTVLETSFISLSFSRTDSAILARNNTPEYLTEKDLKKIKPLLNDKPIRFELKGIY